jgi:hypothetical protein
MQIWPWKSFFTKIKRFLDEIGRAFITKVNFFKDEIVSEVIDSRLFIVLDTQQNSLANIVVMFNRYFDVNISNFVLLKGSCCRLTKKRSKRFVYVAPSNILNLAKANKLNRVTNRPFQDLFL